MLSTQQIGEIRQVIAEHGRLSTDIEALTDETDLFSAGMTSHASVNVLLALEAAFDVEFPDRMLKRSVFESIDAIAAAIAELTEANATV
jgi:acyl carrier protein